jgi:hypothetical protein
LQERFYPDTPIEDLSPTIVPLRSGPPGT